jgi:hypothetical protein
MSPKTLNSSGYETILNITLRKDIPP